MCKNKAYNFQNYFFFKYREKYAERGDKMDASTITRNFATYLSMGHCKLSFALKKVDIFHQTINAGVMLSVIILKMYYFPSKILHACKKKVHNVQQSLDSVIL
jgi:hypothetical protein